MSQVIHSALHRYKPYISNEDFEALLAASTQNAALAVRVNLLKNEHPHTVIQDWQSRYGWQTEAVPFWEFGMQVSNAQTPISQTIEHRFAYYYIQDAASMLPVALFSPMSAGQLLLDMAASPGGKTTQIIDRSQDKAFVIANDSSASRLSALRVVSQSWGMSNGMIANYAGEKLGDWFPETFDRILLDAPCSMESLRVSESHPFRDISTSERDRLASRQVALLISALKAAKIGGEVVYSTCTMAPEENEAVVNAILSLYPQSVSIAEPLIQNPHSKGLTHFQDLEFHHSLQNTMRVWPHLYATNGFFASKLIKTSQIETNKLAIPQRDFSQTGLFRLKEKETAILFKQIFDRFGLTASQFNEFEIYQRESQLFLIPKAYLQHFQTLPYNTLGLPLGKLIKGQLEPGFEFVMRFGDQFENNVWQMPPELQDTWLQGHDLRNLALPANCEPGILAIKNENDVLIGAGKWSAQRLRNLLPHRYLR